MTRTKRRRPPNWSAQTPRKMRTTDPVRIGVPARSPNCASLRPSSSRMERPMIEKIVQTAKQAVKAAVLVHSAKSAPGAGRSTGSCMDLFTASLGERIQPAARSNGSRKTVSFAMAFLLQFAHRQCCSRQRSEGGAYRSHVGHDLSKRDADLIAH